MTARARSLDKSSYPGKVAIRRCVQAARENGIDVAGIEVSPDGTIRITEARAMPKEPTSLYDQLKAVGRFD